MGPNSYSRYKTATDFSGLVSTLGKHTSIEAENGDGAPGVLGAYAMTQPLRRSAEAKGRRARREMTTMVFVFDAATSRIAPLRRQSPSALETGSMPQSTIC